MAPSTIKRIDKVIGREELDPAAKTRCCGPAKDNIIERNICEAAMYTIQPRFQFYDEVVRELEQETEQYTDEDGVQKYYNIEKARLEQLDEDMKYKMVEQIWNLGKMNADYGAEAGEEHPIPQENVEQIQNILGIERLEPSDDCPVLSEEEKEKRLKFWEKVNNRIKEKSDFKRINVYEQEGHEQISQNCPYIKKGTLLQILEALKDKESHGSEIKVNDKHYEL